MSTSDAALKIDDELDGDDPSLPRLNKAISARTEGLTPEAATRDRRALLLMSIRDGADRPPLAQEIFDELSIAIIEGRLSPEDQLNSVALARQFGTSRTPVREALVELERQGVVVVPPRRRPHVARPTLKQVQDVYRLRASLMALVSELIVEACSEEDLRRLDDWQQALNNDAATGAVDDYFWHNVGFRLVEAQLAGNEDLQRMIGSLGLRTLQLRHFSLSRPQRIERSARDHERLLIAYRERDKDTAVSINRSLVMSGYRAIERSGMVG